MVGYTMDGPARDRVMKLIQEKDTIESEIREHNLVLEANNVGMHDALVDADGYPRNDIDVYKVRHSRARIICLQNDHKMLMKQIEQGLGEVHSEFRGSSGEGPSAPNPAYTNEFASSNGVAQEDVRSFAKIGLVQEGSPADLAGLSENDEILQFGTVNVNNFSDITQIHNVVAHSVGQPIQVRVKRGYHVLGITVTPRPWAQPGLLGCLIRRL